jgi:hypothetical protein
MHMQMAIAMDMPEESRTSPDCGNAVRGKVFFRPPAAPDAPPSGMRQP